jgi:hypothetical protein
MPSIYTLEGLGFAEGEGKPAAGCRCFTRKSKRGKVSRFQLCPVPKVAGKKGSCRTGWKITGKCPK